jgi:hypothetical protein
VSPRLRPVAGDRGSLPIAMLLIIIGMGLSGVLAATVTAQIKATRSTVHSSEAIDAAQSGLDVALGHIRLATAADGSGDFRKLPCGPFTGAVNSGTDQTYSVTIAYLTAEPPAGNAAWAQANKLPCTSTYLTAGSPLYVLLSSTGKALSTGTPRTMTATYTLHSKTRENIAGGLIHLYGPHSPDLCFAAPSAVPAAGDPVTMQVCDAAADAQQFAYESGLTLVLVSSRADGSKGMCLDAAPNNREQVLFQPCTATPVPRQQWSLNDRANFEGTTNGTDLNAQCFHLSTPGMAGSTIELHAEAADPPGTSQYARACYSDYTDSRSFAPDAAVGTGRAGAGTEQLVNFQQFGRCLDVSGDDVNAGFLVIWPCKQKPGGAIQWNQVWHLPAIAAGATSGTGRIWLHNGRDNLDYCLTSPGSTAARQYVTVRLCPSGTVGPEMTWTRYAATGVFGTAYRIESAYLAPSGQTWCLTGTDSTDFWQNHGDISKAVLAPCGGSTLQKWNASPTVLQAALTNVTEK